MLPCVSQCCRYLQQSVHGPGLEEGGHQEKPCQRHSIYRGANSYIRRIFGTNGRSKKRYHLPSLLGLCAYLCVLASFLLLCYSEKSNLGAERFILLTIPCHIPSWWKRRGRTLKQRTFTSGVKSRVKSHPYSAFSSSVVQGPKSLTARLSSHIR